MGGNNSPFIVSSVLPEIYLLHIFQKTTGGDQRKAIEIQGGIVQCARQER